MNARQTTGVPENLQVLLDSGKVGYRRKFVYHLNLKVATVGTLPIPVPATYKATGKIVLTPDFGLIKDVWKLLPPRRSEVGVASYYVSEELSIAFPIIGMERADNEYSKPQGMLTRAAFETMTCGGQHPFQWRSDPLGAEIREEDFLRTIATMHEEMTETA